LQNSPIFLTFKEKWDVTCTVIEVFVHVLLLQTHKLILHCMNTSFSCVRKRVPSSKKLSNLLQFMSETLWQSFDSCFQITHRSLFLMLSSVLQQAKESALLCLRLHDW
jgi:hypothetical protein